VIRMSPSLYGQAKSQVQPWMPFLLCLSFLAVLFFGLLLHSEGIRRELHNTLRAQDHAIDLLQEELLKRDTLLDAAMVTVRLQNRRLQTLEATCQQERPL
jgi:uncharacterized membrane protein